MTALGPLVPWAYLVESRLKSRIERVSWVLVNPVPIVAAAWWVTDLPPGAFALAVALAMAAWQSVYETGYLENDLVTTQNEANPTTRLSPERERALRRRYGLVVGAKIALAALLLVGLARVVPLPDVLLFTALVVAARAAFYVHNAVRNRLNIATYFATAVLKYAAVPLLFAPPEARAGVALVMTAAFPIIRTAETACSPRHGLDRLAAAVGDFDVARPVYYAALLAATVAVVLWQGGGLVPTLAVALAGYFLAVRLAAVVVSRTTHREFRARRG